MFLKFRPFSIQWKPAFEIHFTDNSYVPVDLHEQRPQLLPGTYCVRCNIEMVAEEEVVRLTVSRILHTAQHGVQYRHKADSHLTHPMYGAIGPFGGPVLQFFCGYGLVRLLEGPNYNLGLANLVFYRIAEIHLNTIVRDSP